MPTTEILQRKGLKTGIGRALVPSDSTKLQALSCHAFSEFLALVVVQNRGQSLQLTKHFCCSCAVDSSLTRKNSKGAHAQKKDRGDWLLFARKFLCNQQMLLLCVC